MDQFLNKKENKFWQFSLQIYQNPKVKKQLLTWQDHYDLNVNCLLFSLWLKKEGLNLDQAIFIKIIQEVKLTQETVTKPLRTIRKQIKKDPLFNNKALYQSVLQAELESEKSQQNTLYQSVKNLNILDEKKMPLSKDKDYLIWLFKYHQINLTETLKTKIKAFVRLVDLF